MSYKIIYLTISLIVLIIGILTLFGKIKAFFPLSYNDKDDHTKKQLRITQGTYLFLYSALLIAHTFIDFKTYFIVGIFTIALLYGITAWKITFKK